MTTAIPLLPTSPQSTYNYIKLNYYTMHAFFKEFNDRTMFHLLK